MRMTLADFDSFANAFMRYADSKERVLGFRPASVFSAPSVTWLVDASKTMGASIKHVNLGGGYASLYIEYRGIRFECRAKNQSRYDFEVTRL